MEKNPKQIEVTCISQFATVDNVIIWFQYEKKEKKIGTKSKVCTENCDGYSSGWGWLKGGHLYE